eukprot:SM000042S15303  [mRNA]  locus=s42:256902:258699:+ [translate_table: standard]
MFGKCRFRNPYRGVQLSLRHLVTSKCVLDGHNKSNIMHVSEPDHEERGFQLCRASTGRAKPSWPTWLTVLSATALRSTAEPWEWKRLAARGHRDLYYRQALRADPGNPLLLRNYARFLFEIQQDYVRAEEYYERAILANPGDGEILAQYAKLVWDAHHDMERASSYFEHAIRAAPEDCYVLAAHASFLWNSENGDESQAAGGSDETVPLTCPALVAHGSALLGRGPAATAST